MSLQVQSSPLKTLLEIIVKHHIAGPNADMIPGSDSRPLRSASASGSAASPAATPAATNGTKTEDSTADFVLSKHIKFRYFTRNIFDYSVAVFDYLKIVLNLYGIYVSHRSHLDETCSFQPTYTSLMPETDCLSSNNQTCFWAFGSEDHKGNPLLAPVQGNESFTRREPERKTPVTEHTQRSKTNRITRGMMAGPIASTAQVLNF